MVILLPFLSGVAALIYEVLWLKELRRLFGNTAQAAGTTLVAFFIGLSLGSFLLGKLLRRFKNPISCYALFELFIALSALAYFKIFQFYLSVYPFLFEHFAKFPPIFSFFKLLVAATLLFLPAFFMGGTIPALAQRFPTRVSSIYAFNVLGGALGSVMSGFFLPRWLGFRGSYLLAIGLNLSLFLAALLMKSKDQRREKIEINLPVSLPLPIRITLLAFLSGFVVMGLEVLWTHMFALVTINSVYSFALVLMVFLLALTFASFVAPYLNQKFSFHTTAFVTIFAAGVASGFTPLLFSLLTDGLKPLSHASLWGELPFLFRTSMIVMFPPAAMLGVLFPLILSEIQKSNQCSGSMVGSLTGVNTIGAIVGAFFAGFLSLEYLGIWNSISFFSAAYLILLF